MEDPRKKTPKLKLIYSSKLQSEPLTDHDINLNRLDALIDSLAMYENDEDGLNFMLATALVDLIKAKQMYLAWVDEEY